jgi:hypothetical protein
MFRKKTVMDELKFTFEEWLSKGKLFTNLEKEKGYWHSVLANLKDSGVKEVYTIPNPPIIDKKTQETCNIKNIEDYDKANVLKLEMPKIPSLELIDYLLNLKPDRAWGTASGDLCLLFFDRDL